MAEYYKGQTIDPDEEGKFLKIEGERYPYKELKNRCYYNYYHKDGKKDFCKFLSYSCKNCDKKVNKPIELGKIIIDNNPKTKRLYRQRANHVEILKTGVKQWNIWRGINPQIRPILFELNAEENTKVGIKNMKGINFSNANLIEADLTGVDFTKANFHEANLGGAKLIRQHLRKLTFAELIFYQLQSQLNEHNRALEYSLSYLPLLRDSSRLM
jgi:hypothetical protein